MFRKYVVIVFMFLFLFPLTVFAGGGTSLEYSYSRKYTPEDVKKVEKIKGEKPKDTEGTIQVQLWPDAVRVADGESVVFYDFKDDYVYRSSDTGKSYFRVPIYSVTDYLISEGQNRMYLAQVMGAAGVDLAEYNPGELEILFGVPLQLTKTSITASEKDGVYHFVLDSKKEFASYSPSKYKLGGVKRDFLRFLSYEIKTHPDVKNHIAENGTLPESMDFIYHLNSNKVTEKYKLLSVKETDKSAAQQLKSMVITFKTGDALGAITDRVFSGRPIDTEKEKITAKKFIVRALAGGNSFDALLCSINYGLLSGEKNGDLTKLVVPYIKEDSRSSVFINNLKYDSKEGALKATEELASIDQKGLKYGHMIDIMQANAYVAAGEPDKALESFLTALKKEPKVTGAWKDLGELYCGMYEYPQGWLCFEAAEYLKKDHQMLKSIEEKKAALKNAFGEFF